MKKFIIMAMITGGIFFTACNNDDTSTTEVTDSTTIYPDTTRIDTAMVYDSTMMLDTVPKQ